MKTLTEILDDITTAKQKKKLIEKLKANDSFVLRTILQGNFNEKIQFPFPEGEPPFNKKEKKVEVTQAMVSQLGKCTKGAPGILIGKEKTFIEFLESIHQDDASLFCLMKDKKLEQKYPKLKKEVVQEAFPGLI